MIKVVIEPGILKKALRILGVQENTGLPMSITALGPRFQGGPNDAGAVVLKYFDGVKFMTLSFSADVASPGEIFFPAKYTRFFDGANEDVEIIEYKPHLLFKNGSDFKVPFTIEPLLEPQQSPVGSVTVELPVLSSLFRKVAFAAGRDDKDTGNDFRCILLECGSRSGG